MMVGTPRTVVRTVSRRVVLRTVNSICVIFIMACPAIWSGHEHGNSREVNLIVLDLNYRPELNTPGVVLKVPGMPGVFYRYILRAAVVWLIFAHLLSVARYLPARHRLMFRSLAMPASKEMSEHSSKSALARSS